MVNEANFMVRISGINGNRYYVDYMGVYKPEDIAKLVGVKLQTVKEKYLSNSGEYDEEQEVYYFKSSETAQKTISDIFKSIKPEQKGRLVTLTESEIEYIRQALINENSNTIHLSNKIKDNIFKKLNS